MASKLANIAAAALIIGSTLGGFEIGKRIHERNRVIYARDYAECTQLMGEGIYGAKERRDAIEKQWGPNSYLGTVAPFIHWSIYGCLAGLGILGIKRIIRENLEYSKTHPVSLNFTSGSCSSDSESRAKYGNWN